MTYNEIMCKAGRKIKPVLTYENNSITRNDIIKIRPHYSAGLIGTLMRGLELELKVLIPTKSINLKNNANYENDTQIKEYGTYYLKEAPTYNADTKTYTYQFYDEFLSLMIPYKVVEITYPCTLNAYVKKLCETLGLACNLELTNGNNILQNDKYIGLNMTYRDVLEDVGKATFTLFEIVNKELKVCNFKNNVVNINDDLLKNKNITFDKKNGAFNTIILSRSADTDSLSKSIPEDLSDDKKVAYRISDCQLLNDNDRGDYLDNILNKIYGLEYYVYDTELNGYGGFEPLQKIKFVTGGKEFNSYVLGNEEIITQGYEQTIKAPQMSTIEQDYSITDTDDRKLNQVNLIVDKQGKTITAQAQKIDDLDTKTAQLRLDVDKIEGEITEIADITTSGEGTGTISVSNVANDSQPISINVHPTTQHISLIYPGLNLYPSETLYPKDRYLIFSTSNYSTKYRLPKDLWYYDSETYDEYFLDYDAQTCYIIHRVGINADGTFYKLDSQRVEEVDYPQVDLKEGNYTITLEGHPTAYIKARLMAKNIYTDQFVTQVEYKAQVKVTSKEIQTLVTEKVGNDEVISSVNQSAEAIKIKANKIEVDGVINAINGNTSTTINGNKITTGTISANQVSSDIITTNNFNAQQINADNIKSGTLSADYINGGTINASNISLQGVSLSPSVSSIGGLSVASGTISNSRMGLDTANGIIRVFNSNGGSMIFSNAARISATAGVGITSNSSGTVSAPSKNLDLKACSGAVAYLGCMGNSAGTTEKSAVSCESGLLAFRSTGYCTYNGSTVFGSSSRATKENIKDLTQEQKNEVYDLIKNIPTKQYDYKKQYGKPFNYGFVIEDIEDTKLKDLLHITQSETNKDIKMYSTEDLVRLQLITIQELMKKNEELEKRIEKLEKEMK